MFKRFVSIFVLLSAVFSHAQEYAFEEFSLKQGLPQSQVKAINQDSLGFLWIGTLGGLARFDGRSFDVFTIENGLLSNRITFIEFIDNTMYIGHENGLSIYSGNGTFEPVKSNLFKETTRLSGVAKFKNRIIISSNGGGLFELKNSDISYIQADLDDEDLLDEFLRIRQIQIANDVLYIGSRGGLFSTSDLKHFNHNVETEEMSISDLFNSDDGLYIGSYNEGVYLLKSNEHNKTTFEKKSDEACAQLLVDQKQVVWVLTESNKIQRIGGKRFFELSQVNGLPKQMITCLFCDRNGALWFGTEGRGLNKFLGESFTKYTQIETPVLSIVKDRNNRFWFGTLNGGLVVWDKFLWTAVQDDLLIENTIWCSLLDKNGSLWFGSNKGLLQISNNKSIWYTNQSHPNLLDNKITALHEDKTGRIWIGTRKGLVLIENGELKPFEIEDNKEQPQIIRDIKSDGKTLYIATKTSFVSIEIRSRKLKKYDLENLAPTFSCLEIDRFKNVWIGTEEGLLLLVNNEIISFEFTEKSAERFINFIIRKEHEIVVGTNNGIFIISDFDKNLTSYKIRHFNESFGLMNSETNINSAYVDFKNQMWFGTSEGLYKFDESQLNPVFETYKPKLLLRYFEVNFNRFPLPENERTIQLKYSQNRLKFEFQIVDLIDAIGTELEYKLGEEEGPWSSLGSSSDLSFNQLASGKYLLFVRVKGSNGNYSDVLEFSFEINKPFYATWWFILLVAFGVGLFTLAIVRYRIQQIRTQENQERLELNNKLNSLEQQSLNASMNRHFIFNALNSIQYFINTQDKLSANKYLSKFAQLIRKNLDSSAAGENYVTLNEEIQRLELYLSLESMRFESRFSYHFEIAPNIDTEEVRIPPMLFQPFVENAIIHGILPDESKMGIIRFEAKENDNSLEFKISDNGVGFSNSLKIKKDKGDHFSHGTQITKSRIEVIRKISGNIISMEGPRDLLDENDQIIGTEVIILIGV